MAIVQLPSGRRAEIPDEIAEQGKETVTAYIVDKLKGNEEYADDFDVLRARLPKDYDWISDVTGGIGGLIGGIGGGLIGTALGPVGTAGGAVAGGTAGGAIGGAAGEAIESLFDTDRGRSGSEVASTGIKEGAWGLLPGVGGLLIKPGARAGGRFLAGISRFFGGRGGGFSDDVLKGLSKFSPKQHADFFNRYVKKKLTPEHYDSIVKKLSKEGIDEFQLVDAFADPKKHSDVIKNIHKALKGDAGFERGINAMYQEMLEEGVKRGYITQSVARVAFDQLSDEEEGYYNNRSKSGKNTHQQYALGGSVSDQITQLMELGYTQEQAVEAVRNIQAQQQGKPTTLLEGDLAAAPNPANRADIYTKPATVANQKQDDGIDFLTAAGGAAQLGKRYLQSKVVRDGLLSAAEVGAGSLPLVGEALDAAQIGKGIYDLYQGDYTDAAINIGFGLTGLLIPSASGQQIEAAGKISKNLAEEFGDDAAKVIIRHAEHLGATPASVGKAFKELSKAGLNAKQIAQIFHNTTALKSLKKYGDLTKGLL